MAEFEHVNTERVFYHFEEICSIPRGSGNMEKISSYCVEFAKKHNLRYYSDSCGNVVIYKNGTAGYENSLSVIIQGHLDMVCQKTEDCNIDFTRDGLDIYADGDFLMARGTQIYPAVLSVGYICGARIASFMFAGGVLSWLVIIPMIVLFGADTIMYPRTETIGEMYAAGGAGAIWSSYIRYIGAGALAAGMCSAIAIGSIICIVSAIAGDTSQDLKTGYILGSTPKKQQIGEIIGVVCSALAIGGTLYLLDSAYGFGSDQIAAPQATLMKLIVEGVMGGKLPWNLVFIGAIIAVIVEIIRIPVLPFAIGIYLPVQLNACIMVGGLIRLAMDKMKKTEEEKKEITNDGILFCSGMIAGEGLVGILLAFLAVLGADKAIDLSAKLGLSGTVMNIGGLVLFGIIILTVFKFSLWKKRAKNNE